MTANRGRSVHDEFRILAAASVDGRISPDEAAALDVHLAGCPDCRADLAGMLQDHAWLATPGSVAPPDPRVRDVVIEAARSARVPRTGDRQRPWEALAAAAVMIAVIGAGLLFAGSRVPGAGSASPAATSTRTPTASNTSLGSRCVPIPAGLTARWTFDDPVERFSGVETLLTGNPRSVVGVAGSAIELTGSATGAVVPDTRVGALGTSDFTVVAWVRFVAVAGEQVVVERFVEGSSPEGWTLTKLDTGEIRFAFGVGNAEFTVDTTGTTMTSEVWHHIAARRQGRTVSVFVDGLEAGVAELAAGAQVDVAVDKPLLFGRRGDARGFHLQGDLDEILIWTDRGLSDAEILDLKNAGTRGFCEAAADAGYEGVWGGIDCPSDESAACEGWGDGSQLSLEIGEGEEPEIRFSDSSVPGCGTGGTPGPRSATGRGRFDGVHLVATFTTVSCVSPANSFANPMDLYKPYGDASIWFDPDGDELGILLRPG